MRQGLFLFFFLNLSFASYSQQSLQDSVKQVFEQVKDLEKVQTNLSESFEKEVKPVKSLAEKVNNILSYKGLLLGLLGLAIASFVIYYQLLSKLKPILESKLKDALTQEVVEREKIYTKLNELAKGEIKWEQSKILIVAAERATLEEMSNTEIAHFKVKRSYVSKDEKITPTIIKYF